ncbi:MAG: hypothetical protein ACKO3T_20180 [Planctomycetaceae bacterium]
MPKVYTFPRAARGASIYRVEWNKDVPYVAEYIVQTSATSSIVVHDSEGQEHILVGKVTLRQYGKSPEDAIFREFERLATLVARNGANARQALQQTVRLGKLSV